jgi:hypothetical protein
MPFGNITVNSGHQIVYGSQATIQGQGYEANYGTTVNCANVTTSCVQSYNESSSQLYGAHLSNFSIAPTGTWTAGSVALAIGGSGYADVLQSEFSDIKAGSASVDVGVRMGGDAGCTCYNVLYNVTAVGKSIGAQTYNFSSYSGDTNSNHWIGGQLSGPVGLYDSGGGKFTFEFVDMESNTSSNGAIIYSGPDGNNAGTGYNVGDTVRPAGGDGTAVLTVRSVLPYGGPGYVTALTVTTPGTTYDNVQSVAATTLTGSGTGLRVDLRVSAYMLLVSNGDEVVNPYEEAGAGDYICGTGNFVTGTFSTGNGGTYNQSTTYCTGTTNGYGGPASNFIWGPGATPASIGLGRPAVSGAPYIAYGQTNMYDPAYASAYQPSFNFPQNLYGNGTAWTGGDAVTYGKWGWSDWNVGVSYPHAGTAATGKTTYSAISNPGAPTLSVNGGTGTTSAAYGLVCNDGNGGTTLPATPTTTISGPATLGAVQTVAVLQNYGGSGFVAGDVGRTFTLGSNGTGVGSGFTGQITAVSGGKVTGVSVTTAGSGYNPLPSPGGSGALSYPLVGGSGSGAYVTITASYVEVIYPQTQGCASWTVLKGSTSAQLNTVGSYATGSTNAAANIIDFGNSTIAYTPSSRNTTGDQIVSGYLQAAQYSVGSNAVIPSTVSGYQGSSGTKVQLGVGTTTSGDCASFAADGSIQDSGAACGGGSGSFSSLGGGTNTSAAMVMGSGASLAASGTGTIAATSMPASGLSGAALPANVTGSSLAGVGTLTSGTWNATPIANAYLANPSVTVAGLTCTLGGSCAIAAANLSNGASGTGAVALVNGPTFTGNATTFANGSANQDYVTIQPGTGGTDQIGAVEFANSAGASQWEIRKDATNTFRIRDTANSLDRFIQYAAGQTEIGSGGAAAVAINNTSSSGTGGLIVYEGGANFNTAAFSVNSSGNAAITGTTTMGGHLNQSATGKVGGSCTMSASTSCTVTMGASFTTPLCVATVQGAVPIAAACSISGTTVTVTAASSNSATWAVFFFGNPN